ncbi:MAG: type I secretion system permease/ATPase [Burkholderiales bacterium]|nr:type I secretion system permease/ATPase [Burkholderiales bacterium]
MTDSHADTGLVSLALIARLHGVAADPDQLAHELALAGRVASTTEVLQAAKRLGLKAKRIVSTAARLARSPLPAIAESADGGFFVLAQAEGGRYLVHDPREGRAQVLDTASLEAHWTGGLVLLASRASVAGALARFDFTWFVPALVKYRKLLGEVLIASLFIQLFALVTPLFFQVVMDKVLVHQGYSTLTVIGAALLAVSIFEALLSGLRTYVFAHTASRIDVELGARLFRHLVRLPIAYFEARRVGDSVARVRELESIRQFLTGSALTVVLDLLFSVVFIAVMVIYSGWLTLVVLASLPLYVLISVAVTPVLRRLLHERFNRGAENQAFLVETVSGMPTVKAMAAEPHWTREWDKQLASYVAASFRVVRLGSVASESVGLVNRLVTVGVLWIGAYLVIDGQLTVGGLIAFNMLAARVAQPVMRLAQLWQDFQQTGISVERLGDILNTLTEVAPSAQGSLPPLQGRVEFDQVRFRYRPDADEVLRGMSFAMEPGQVVGIVGRSGSGKSTVAKLIQRLHTPERGRVLIDGTDLALVDPAWLRRQLGVVLQENVLFARTVRENISLADPGAPMDEVIAAARLAGADDFIRELPQGYDAVVGEHGATLSGGQRQRIAIARALMTKPRILILDEATSALDYESERVIQANMAEICRGRTVVVIAHRLSSVRHADRILVFERGEIVEQGTHEALLAIRNGHYHRLWALQQGPSMRPVAPESEVAQ